MILKALTLENFKGIREPVRIEFAPLTLLFGPNNAGKSTIVQALMYAREVLERDNCDARCTELGGDTVDLGGFNSLVHCHDTTRRIRMRFDLDIDLAALIAGIKSRYEDDELADDDGLEIREIDDVVDLPGFSARGTDSDGVWVELEIGWVGSGSHKSLGAPTVRRYCIGSGTAKCAEIAVDDKTGQTQLKFLDGNLFPMAAAAHYAQGDKSDFDWDLERLRRAVIREELATRGSSRFGLSRGATIASPGKAVRKGDNKMAREDFDELVLKVVRGEELWGDDSVDPETGKHNPNFTHRQKLLELAEAAGRWRSLGGTWLEEDLLRVEPGLPGIGPLEIVNVADNPEGQYRTRIFHLLQPHGLLDTEEHDAQLRLPMGLDLNGTALPEWNEPLTEGDWRDDANSMLRALSPLIIRPGELLVNMLQDAVYLGPYRRLPSRDFRLSDEPSKRDWGSGLAAWYALAGPDNPSLVARVNHWLSGSRTGFRTDYAVAVQRYKSLPVDGELWRDLMTGDLGAMQESIRDRLARLPEDANKLELYNIKAYISMAPQDLGMGISQLIPVVVAVLTGCNPSSAPATRPVAV